MLAPTILAAGRSTRMGTAKALLEDDQGRPLVARLARTFAAAGFAEITVVTGHLHESIAAALAGDRPPIVVKFARNPDPDRGQLSSIWTALDAMIGSDTSAMMLALVDVPFVTSGTVRAVAEGYARTHAPIVRPAIGARHGHPVIFDKSLFDELRRADLEVGAKSVVRAHASEILNVEVVDEGAVMDLDTPEDYVSALERARHEP